MNGNNLSDKIKERRKEKGLTLTELSTKSGISASHLARIERGERFPSGCLLRKLAKPLDFSEVELLKLAGFLSQDDSDERLDKFKQEIKREIAHALDALLRKIDTL